MEILYNSEKGKYFFMFYLLIYLWLNWLPQEHHQLHFKCSKFKSLESIVLKYKNTGLFIIDLTGELENLKTSLMKDSARESYDIFSFSRLCRVCSFLRWTNFEDDPIYHLPHSKDSLPSSFTTYEDSLNIQIDALTEGEQYRRWKMLPSIC